MQGRIPPCRLRRDGDHRWLTEAEIEIEDPYFWERHQKPPPGYYYLYCGACGYLAGSLIPVPHKSPQTRSECVRCGAALPGKRLWCEECLVMKEAV
jgi:hypothetical protein